MLVSDLYKVIDDDTKFCIMATKGNKYMECSGNDWSLIPQEFLDLRIENIWLNSSERCIMIHGIGE